MSSQFRKLMRASAAIIAAYALVMQALFGAVLLGLLGHYRIGAEINVLISAATTACAL